MMSLHFFFVASTIATQLCLIMRLSASPWPSGRTLRTSRSQSRSQVDAFKVLGVRIIGSINDPFHRHSVAQWKSSRRDSSGPSMLELDVFIPIPKNPSLQRGSQERSIITLMLRVLNEQDPLSVRWKTRYQLKSPPLWNSSIGEMIEVTSWKSRGSIQRFDRVNEITISETLHLKRAIVLQMQHPRKWLEIMVNIRGTRIPKKVVNISKVMVSSPQLLLEPTVPIHHVFSTDVVATDFVIVVPIGCEGV